MEGIGDTCSREILYFLPHVTKFSGFVGKRIKIKDQRRGREREVTAFVPKDVEFLIKIF